MRLERCLNSKAQLLNAVHMCGSSPDPHLRALLDQKIGIGGDGQAWVVYVKSDELIRDKARIKQGLWACPVSHCPLPAPRRPSLCLSQQPLPQRPKEHTHTALMARAPVPAAFSVYPGTATTCQLWGRGSLLKCIPCSDLRRNLALAGEGHPPKHGFPVT